MTRRCSRNVATVAPLGDLSEAIVAHVVSQGNPLRE